MRLYQVTFCADDFVLKTHVDVDPSAEISRDSIIYNANNRIRKSCGFEPQKYSFDIEIKEVN
jgi:hypothetical protein